MHLFFKNVQLLRLRQLFLMLFVINLFYLIIQGHIAGSASLMYIIYMDTEVSLHMTLFTCGFNQTVKYYFMHRTDWAGSTGYVVTNPL